MQGLSGVLNVALRGTFLMLPMIGGGTLAAAEAGVILVRDAAVKLTVVASEELFQGSGLFVREAGRKESRLFADVAQEQLANHLRKIDSKAQIRTIRADAAGVARATNEASRTGQPVIVLSGPKADPKSAESIRERGADPESFWLEARGNIVRIVGLTPKGTLNGTLDLLEQVGFRWFMPGELGLVVPTEKTLAVVEQTKIAVPSFRCRQLAGSVLTAFPDWSLQVRNSAWTVPGSHGLPTFRGAATRQKLFASHPEYYAEIGGVRQPKQVCISNPEILRLTAAAVKEYFRENPEAEFIGLGPDDGGGFCECEKCRALDGGDQSPFSNRFSVTDRYFWFFNKLLKEIEGEFPDKKIGTLIYGNYIMPPVKVKPDPRITGRLALIHLCRIHSPRNPICPEAHFYRHVCEGWHKTGIKIFNSGYWFNLADPGLPFPMLSRLADEIPLAHELGHIGFARSTGVHWASEGPSLYLVAKLMWDHTGSVEALLDDYCAKFYGPASVPMREYWMLLDGALKNADFHTGRSWDMPNLYPADVRRRARLLLDQAAEQTSDTVFGRRVGIARQSLDYLDHFVAMIEDRNRHDFVSSQRHLEAARDLVQRLIKDYDVPMLRTSPSSVAAARFLEMYYAEVTDQGAARITGGNDFVASVSDRWQLFVDQLGVGEKLELFKPEITGGNWQTITSSSSWGNQGLRYYFGEAWYRQQVTVPDKFRGRKIRLWFAGVDDAARVWLNGQLLGDSPGAVFDLDAHGGSMKPFEMDATAALRHGEANTIVVRVHRNKSNELGSGGILGPVMFYAAAEKAEE